MLTLCSQSSNRTARDNQNRDPFSQNPLMSQLLTVPRRAADSLTEAVELSDVLPPVLSGLPQALPPNPEPRMVG